MHNHMGYTRTRISRSLVVTFTIPHWNAVFFFPNDDALSFYKKDTLQSGLFLLTATEY